MTDMELMKLRAGEYRISGEVNGRKVKGAISTVTGTGLGHRWMWYLGFSVGPNERFSAPNRYAKTFKDAKAQAEAAFASLTPP